ncbi:MAG TPA: transglutaminase-like domain-containing protein [Gemmataceae bacterium]|jgi:regulator of sirC expression with transglutaminase-like and TPR domain|nr:transglutaminase-like domain-containing protein [Gemmataceae bacterium]
MSLDDVLNLLAADADADLDVAEVALLLARDEYPQLDVRAYLDQLRDLARDARGHIGGDQAEQLAGLCRYLFHEIGLRGNAKDYYDPRNSYLSDVLDRLTGIPITLSVVTIAVGRRLGLPLIGLGLPGHFVVQCAGADPPLIVDPFHGGRSLTVDQCRALSARIVGVDIPLSPSELAPPPLGLIVQRMLGNLRGIYLQREDWRRAARTLGRMHQLSPSDVQVSRDLGVCLLRTQQPGRALVHLETYLRAAPDADDVSAIRDLLAAAVREVGRWN